MIWSATGLFPLGRIVWTPAVGARIADDQAFSRHVWQSLRRHAAGDWGDVGVDDRQTNNAALDHGGLIFSGYVREEKLRDKIWIITDASRASTCILFSENC